MKHPAFNTNSDYASRKAESAKLQKKEDEQKKQTEEKKKEEQQKNQQSNLSSDVQTSSNQASDDQTSSKEEEKDAAQQQKTDESKTATQPVLSSQIEARLSAIKEATKSQMSAMSSVINANDIANKANATLSSLCAPIYQALDKLKELPDKLRSSVDIDGAKVSMYSQLGKLSQTVKKIGTIVTSVEVPITLDDYTSSPTSYPKLEAQQKVQNYITEGDCLSSGYTKTQLSVTTSISTDMKQIQQKPEEQGTVAKTCEQMFSAVIKPMWQTVSSPIQTVASIANIGPLGDMVQGVVDMIDGIAQIASTPVPEDKLNEKISEHNLAGEAYAASADKVANANSSAKKTANEAIDSAKKSGEEVKKQLDEQQKAVKEAAKDAFSKMKMPPMPDGLDESLKDLWDAVTMVVANIQNVFIVALFKLLEAVFKCFNQIVGVIGVPTLPYPLNILPTLIMNAIDIMTFVMGLPMSLMNSIKAIAKRKVKAAVVANLPPPPKPEEPIEQVEPTSEDVPKPDTTWKDVQDALKKRWKFSSSDASKIVSDLQTFYDGSYDEDESLVDVLIRPKYNESAKENDTDTLWEDKQDKRVKLLPQTALEEWIPQHLDSGEEAAAGTIYILMVPTKHSPNNKMFYIWFYSDDEKKWKKNYYDDPFQWECYTYMSQS